MSNRVVAALGAGAATALTLLLAVAPAGAQTYPPAPNAITVDDPTPARGQVVNVTLTTCRPGTYALIGVDLLLVATPVVGSDGAARAAVTIPTTIRPGRHLVSGACLTPGWAPLFLTTHITVARSGSGGGAGSGSAPLAGGGTGISGGSRQPSLDALAGEAVPADAALLYQTTALANGVGGSGSSGSAATGNGTSDGRTTGATDSGPGTLGTVARVALGLAAIGGVPVAMAIGRRPSAAVRSGFA
jgi:hypothetical protein